MEQQEEEERLIEINQRWKDIYLFDVQKEKERPCGITIEQNRKCKRCDKDVSSSCCGGCSRVFYCSERCQRADWTEENHMKECYYMGSQSYHESVVLEKLEKVISSNDHETLEKMVNGTLFGFRSEKDKKLIPALAISVITYWCLSTSLNEHTGQTFLHVAAERGFWRIVQLILRCTRFADPLGKLGETPLDLAAANGRSRVVDILVREGKANVYHERWPRQITPLHSACGSKDLDTVKILVNAESKLIHKCDRKGRYPIHVAASNGNAAIVSFLLQCGASCDVRTNTSHTPLHHATMRGKVQVVKVLLNAMSSCKMLEIPTDDEFKRTPLMFAAMNGYLDICKMLCKHGAMTRTKDANGDTAALLAKDRGHTQAWGYLQSSLTETISSQVRLSGKEAVG